MAKLKNSRYESFVNEYIIDFNATRAAKDAGYSEKTAGSKGHGLLKIVEIQDRVSELIKERIERTQITQDRVVLELSKVAFSNISDYLEWGAEGARLRQDHDVSIDAKSAIQSIKTKRRQIRMKGMEDYEVEDVDIEFKLHDKMRALELLAKHLGMMEAKGTKDDPIHQVGYSFDDWKRTATKRRNKVLETLADAEPQS